MGTVWRILASLALLILIFAGSRALIRWLPGDPLETLVAESGTQIDAGLLRSELGLDRPFMPALVKDLGKFAKGDWGVSLMSKRPVLEILTPRIGRTLELTALSLSISLFLALWLGVLAGTKPDSFADHVCSVYSAMSASLPSAWLGPMLMIATAVWIPLFQISGGIALPALTLSLSISGSWARLIRTRVRENLHYGAMTGARARGIPEWKVALKYGLAPASGALIAYLGTQWGFLMAGAFVTEVIFDWRGMGSLLVESTLKRDYPVVEAGAFVTAAFCLLGTALGDFLQTQVDARQREPSR